MLGEFAGIGKLKIINCYNVEKVKSIGNYVGGMAGNVELEEANNCYNSAWIGGNNFIGSLFSEVTTSSADNIKNCAYLKGTAVYGIWDNDFQDLLQPSDTLPSVLSVVNADHAFVEDTNNINDGYPIFNWQDK